MSVTVWPQLPIRRELVDIDGDQMFVVRLGSECQADLYLQPDLWRKSMSARVTSAGGGNDD